MGDISYNPEFEIGPGLIPATGILEMPEIVQFLIVETG
jgi:hypothetical protein